MASASGVIRGAGTERLLEFEPPPLLSGGFIGTRLRQARAALVEGRGSGGKALLAARRIVLGFGIGFSRLTAGLSGLWVGASLKQPKASHERAGNHDACFHGRLFNTPIAILRRQA